MRYVVIAILLLSGFVTGCVYMAWSFRAEIKALDEAFSEMVALDEEIRRELEE